MTGWMRQFIHFKPKNTIEALKILKVKIQKVICIYYLLGCIDEKIPLTMINKTEIFIEGFMCECFQSG